MADTSIHFAGLEDKLIAMNDRGINLIIAEGSRTRRRHNERRPLARSLNEEVEADDRTPADHSMCNTSCKQHASVAAIVRKRSFAKMIRGHRRKDGAEGEGDPRSRRNDLFRWNYAVTSGRGRTGNTLV